MSGDASPLALRRGLRRCVIAMVLLAGLVSMHGLGVYDALCHDRGLTLASTSSTTAAATATATDRSPGRHLPAVQLAESAGTIEAASTAIRPAHAPPVTGVVQVASALTWTAVEGPSEVCFHGSELCVAVLTALLLLMLLLAGVRRRGRGESLGTSDGARPWLGRGPPRVDGPSLFVLCQLRT